MNPEIIMCLCGKPLHYMDKQLEAAVIQLVQQKGETIPVTDSTGRTWAVPRHYMALHGITEQDLSTLGFEEVIK